KRGQADDDVAGISVAAGLILRAITIARRLRVRDKSCEADTGEQSGAGCFQFLSLSTSAFALIHGIMARSFSPTCSIWCCASLARVALNEVWLTLFSSIQLRVKMPD